MISTLLAAILLTQGNVDSSRVKLNTYSNLVPDSLRKALIFHAPLKGGGQAFGLGSLAPTVSRASDGLYQDFDGIIRTASSNTARFEYDNAGRPRGLLMEAARTNSALRSNEFDSATWAKQNSVVTANDITGPDGTASAEKLADNSSTNQHFLQQSITGTPSATNTLSIYAKAGTKNFISLGFTGASNDLLQFFDLSTGSVGAVDEIGGAYSVEAKITPVGSAGWYRCEARITVTADTPTVAFIHVINSDGTRSYTGDGTGYIHIWGYQYEKGASFASSPIVTSGTTATRALDSFTYPSGKNLPEPGPGTIFLVADSIKAVKPERQDIVTTRRTDFTHGVLMAIDASTADIRWIISAASNQMNETTTADDFIDNVSKSVALTFDTNDGIGYSSGVLRVTDTTINLPTNHDIIKIGAARTDANPLFGHVRDVYIFNRILTGREILKLRSFLQ